MSEWPHTGLSPWSRAGAHEDAAGPCGAQGLARENRSPRSRGIAQLLVDGAALDGLVPAGAREDRFRQRAAHSPRRLRHPGPADAISATECGVCRAPSVSDRRGFFASVGGVPFAASSPRIRCSWRPSTRSWLPATSGEELACLDTRDQARRRCRLPPPDDNSRRRRRRRAQLRRGDRRSGTLWQIEGVGPVLGLTPSRYQSGATDRPAAGHFGAITTPLSRWAPSADADRIK